MLNNYEYLENLQADDLAFSYSNTRTDDLETFLDMGFRITIFKDSVSLDYNPIAIGRLIISQLELDGKWAKYIFVIARRFMNIDVAAEHIGLYNVKSYLTIGSIFDSVKRDLEFTDLEKEIYFIEQKEDEK